MKVSLKKAFSLLDGRLSTEVGDVYEMLNFIYSDNFMTHQLPTAMRKLKELNPTWFSQGVILLDDIKTGNGTNNFKELMDLIDRKFPTLEIELEKADIKIDFMAGLEKLGSNI